MNIKECQSVIKKCTQEFDSHDFIRFFIYESPDSYGELLIKHHNVTTAHAEIANFLKKHSEELGIEEVGTNESIDLFNNCNKCAKWQKTNRH